MTRIFDAIVLGVGAMGSATCAEFARRGFRVLGLEQFDVPHALGSSGGQTRLVRKAYFEHPDYVPLLHRAYELWQQFGDRTGHELLHRTGLVYVGRPDSELVQGVLRSATEHRIAVETLDDVELSARAAPMILPDGFTALFEPDAGFVLSERAIEAFTEDALRQGAEIHARERVDDWSAGGDVVEVRTDRGTYHAARLVITAGAWSARLLRDLGIDLRVTRQVTGWTWPEPPDAFEIGAFPCWAAQDDAPGFHGLYYGFPLLPSARFAGARGLKVGHHHAGAEVAPDQVDRTPNLAEEEGFRSGLRRFLPTADGPLLGARVCLYTMTSDGDFVVDRHPGNEAVTVACGFSGHGFKFAPVIAEALADLAIEGRTALPIGFLALDRPPRT